MYRWLLLFILALEGSGMCQNFHRCGSNEPWTNCLDRRDLKITDPNEYAAYLNAMNQKEDNARAASLEAFLEQFPDSPVKVRALEQLMAAYEKLSNSSRMTGTADRLLQADPNDLRALAYMARLKRREAASKPGDEMQKPLAEAVQYAQRGLQVLPNKTNEAVQKSRRDSTERSAQHDKQKQNEAELEKSASDTTAIFNGVIGYADLQHRDYPSAQRHLQDAVDANPTNLEDIYPLGHAYLEGWPPPLPAQTPPPATAAKGIWYLARAASVRSAGDQKAGILKYGHSVYVRFHGGDEGWESLVQQAAEAPMPPANFSIKARRPPVEELEPARMPEAHARNDSSTAVIADVRSNGMPRPSNVAYAVPASGSPPPSSSVSASTTTHAWRQVYTVPAGAVASRTSDGSAVLTTAGSRAVLREINTTRGNLKGLNSQPLPPGQITAHAFGSLTISAFGGREFEVRPDGTVSAFRGKDTAATFTRNGHVSSLRTAKLEVRNGIDGRRTVVIHGPGNTLTVSHGRHNGYVQREVKIGEKKTALIQRTYKVNGVTTIRLYRNYSYRGATLPLYLPKMNFTPAFLGWAYYPWKTPVTYSWPHSKPPPHGSHTIFFIAWPVYSGAATWLTDYYLGQVTQDPSSQPGTVDDTQAPGEAYVPVYDGAPADDAIAAVTSAISLDVKQMIADEVQQQLAQENAASQNPSQVEDLIGLQREMQPGHVFVADEQLYLVTADLHFCQLSPGAVLTLIGPHDEGGDSAELTVNSSRAGECAAGTKVIVALEDLQEMQNSFRAGLESGLQTLQEEQGKNGLPEAPMAAILPPPFPAEDEPPAQSDVDEALAAAEHDANKVEASLTAAAFAPASR